MKLLFDQNISYRLIKKIFNAFPLAHNLRFLGLNNASDIEIWRYAKANGYTIVTFDSDFLDFNTLYGSPPKIIWLRTGNMTTINLAKLILDRELLILNFQEDKDAEILQILAEK